jgi:hypothetical protein
MLLLCGACGGVLEVFSTQLLALGTVIPGLLTVLISCRMRLSNFFTRLRCLVTR